MSQQKIRPRAEYRRQQTLRANASPSLAEKYGGLKSLTVNLEYYEADGVRKMTEIKYTVNLVNTKSVFSFNCPRSNCVGGDFDLSERLANAVAAHLKTATGQICCQGRQNWTANESSSCRSVLRYKLRLQYRGGIKADY